MVFLLDNYDSFTFNLAHGLRLATGQPFVVRRCDEVTVEEVLALSPKAIVISPGPGRPRDRGIACDLVTAAAGKIPLLGVCLGHQAIGLAFGARLVRGPRPVHGHSHPIVHGNRGAFRGISAPITAMRYHSLVLDPASLPSSLEATATLASDREVIMGIRHRIWPIEGFQFHPESFLTPSGPRLISNFFEVLE